MTRKLRRGPRGPAAATRVRSRTKLPPIPPDHMETPHLMDGELPEWAQDGDEYWYTEGDQEDDGRIYLWRVYGRCCAKSKQSQRRCRRLPSPGGYVCVIHGGKAPQVRKLAEKRLEALALPAIKALTWWVQQREFPATAATMINSVLDRTGFEAVSKTKHSGSIASKSEEQQELDQEVLELLQELKTR